MDHLDTQRPVRRRNLQIADAGVDDARIGWRFRRTPGKVRPVLALTQLPRQDGRAPSADRLQPTEHRSLQWPDQRAGFGVLAARFRRGPALLEQVEQLARHGLTR